MAEEELHASRAREARLRAELEEAQRTIEKQKEQIALLMKVKGQSEFSGWMDKKKPPSNLAPSLPSAEPGGRASPRALPPLPDEAPRRPRLSLEKTSLVAKAAAQARTSGRAEGQGLWALAGAGRERGERGSSSSAVAAFAEGRRG